MENTKITQKDMFAAIIETINGAAIDEAVKAEQVAFVEKKIEQLENKAAKAKERAAETKAKGDEMRAAVEAVLTDEAQTIADITAQVKFEDVTRAKVTSRLTALVKAGVAVKETVKVDGRGIAAYRLATEADADALEADAE